MHKFYDFRKAKRYIEVNHDVIEHAELGMDEAWSCTRKTIYQDGRFTLDLDKEGLEICGIDGSNWATPTLKITLKDGTIITLDVFT